MESKTYIFDEWEHVDCNDCTHYWNETCDGVSEGSERLCKGFKATRRVNIPERLNECQRGLKSLSRGQLILNIIVLLHLIGHLIEAFVR